jgi:hypothetical protein
LPVDNANTQRVFSAIANWMVASQQFTPAAKNRFLAGGDPWLVAKASVIGATVVTYETHEPNSKKSVKIPTACLQFGVIYVNTFDILRAAGAIIGHGQVPVVQCLRMMRKEGYNGILSVEYEGIEDVLVGVQAGHDNLRKMVDLVEG